MQNHLRRYQTNEIFDVVKFVVKENFSHHEAYTPNQHYISEIDSVYNEESAYCQNAKIYVERDEYGAILGSVRVLKWNFVDSLPIQKIFGINPLNHIELDQINDVYHFGRLAIQKHCPSLQLFKKLIAIAINPVCEHHQNVAFAECDSKLIRILALLGIEIQVIGDPIHYLGSDTIPVMFSYNDLIDFHIKSK